MDVVKYNSEAWDREVTSENKWTVPLTHEEYLAAKKGEYTLLLTPTKNVPKKWLGKIKGKKVLCLGGGGGQQSAVLAALGADVTVFDASAAQLAQDKKIAKRENINIDLEQGDMRDLSELDDGQFDMIFHPVSNCFVEEIDQVWKECFRVLKRGGILLSGFANPLRYLFDCTAEKEEGLVVRHKLPYSDLKQLTEQELKALTEKGQPLEFGHSLEAQIGGQLDAGFVLAGLYEDISDGDLLDEYTPTYIATRAFKL